MCLLRLLQPVVIVVIIIITIIVLINIAIRSTKKESIFHRKPQKVSRITKIIQITSLTLPIILPEMFASANNVYMF